MSKRKRQQRGAGTRSLRELGESVLEVARLRARGAPTLVGVRSVERLCQQAGPRTLATAADMTLQQVIGQMWPHGWLPVDLWQAARRRLDEPAVGLLLDAIAEDVARYPQAGFSQRWTDQLQQLAVEVWWQREAPHLTQWATRHGRDLTAALSTAIEVLALLLWLPKLPLIEPLPGKSTTKSTGHGVEAKVLERVRGLLAKAESTSFPEEAEALSAKAQQLMNRHAFERALLDDTEERPPAAGSTRLWLDNPYLDAKAMLVNAVAEANRCKLVQHGNLGFVSLVGDELDLEITELLATSLLVQATGAMVAEGKQTVAGTSRTRSFRRSFLLAYATRIGERLAEADAAAKAEASNPRLLPVLADRSEVVQQEFDRMFGLLAEKSVSVSNGHGWHAGRAAADRADLGLQRTQVNG